MEITISFDSSDADEGVGLLAREVPDDVRRTLRQVEEDDQPPGAKHRVLRAADLTTVVLAVDSALVLLTPLTIWLGRGKKVTVRQGDTELTMENLRTDEMERMLTALDRRA